jgi:hypothetical protein
MAEAILKREAKTAITAEVKDRDENQYYIACRRCNRPGVWLTQDPRGQEIHVGMWYSIHHELGDPWLHPTGKMLCQFCFIEGGEEVDLCVEARRDPVGGTVYTLRGEWYREYLRKAPKAEYDKMLADITKQAEEVTRD